MRSRSALEPAGTVLGASAEGVWCGAVAAAVTGSSWAPLALFAACVTAAAAFAAARLAGREGHERGGRVLLLLLAASAAGVLLVVGRGWAHDYLLWQVVRDVAFTSALVYLGSRLGRDAQAPEDAVRRAVRAFALVCGALVIAATVGPTPAWATAALVAALVVGGLLIAVVRYLALTHLVADADRLPAGPWLFAVTGAVVAVVVIAALASQLLTVDVLRWLLDVVGGALHGALDFLGWLIGWAGAGLLRALDWLLGLFHVSGPGRLWTPAPEPRVQEIVPKDPIPLRDADTTRLIITVAGAVAAIAVSLGVILLAHRRLRRREVPERAVVEEREALGSLRATVGAFAGGLGRRLRRGLSRLHPREPRSPAELVRRRYAELERRLAAAGQPRLPGVTVREYLAAVRAAPAIDGPPGPPALAADLAALYELARYSAHVVDAVQAARFESLARAFLS